MFDTRVHLVFLIQKCCIDIAYSLGVFFIRLHSCSMMFHIAELISSHFVGDHRQAHTHTVSIPINCIWICTVELLKLKHGLPENPQFSSMSFLGITWYKPPLSSGISGVPPAGQCDAPTGAVAHEGDTEWQQWKMRWHDVMNTYGI